MDESKDLPGPGGSSREDRPGWFWKPLDSHPALWENHGARSSPAHIYGKAGKEDRVGKPHSLHQIFYSWVSEDFVPASSLRTLLPS